MKMMDGLYDSSTGGEHKYNGALRTLQRCVRTIDKRMQLARTWTGEIDRIRDEVCETFLVSRASISIFEKGTNTNPAN